MALAEVAVVAQAIAATSAAAQPSAAGKLSDQQGPASVKLSSSAVAAIALASLSIGYATGRYEEQAKAHHVLPDGMPRTCCDHHHATTSKSGLNEHDIAAKMEHKKKLLTRLEKIVGKDQVLDGEVESTSTLPFLKGARLGFGHALAIVSPKSLQEVVDVVQAVIDADCGTYFFFMSYCFLTSRFSPR